MVLLRFCLSLRSSCFLQRSSSFTVKLSSMSFAPMNFCSWKTLRSLNLKNVKTAWIDLQKFFSGSFLKLAPWKTSSDFAKDTQFCQRGCYDEDSSLNLRL